MRPLALALLVAASVAARAQDVAPPAPLTLAATLTATTDARFRGLSRSDLRPAAQATLEVRHRSGAYLLAYAANAGGPAVNGADAELDLTAGLRRTTASGTTIEGGVTLYGFPGAVRGAGTVVEPFTAVSHTLGPATGRLLAAYAPPQRALSLGGDGPARDRGYLAGELAAGLPGTPYAARARVGRTFGSDPAVGHGYLDWTLEVTRTRGPLALSVAYVDTDAHVRPRDVARAALVASAALSF